jgi:hypothetical protein
VLRHLDPRRESNGKVKKPAEWASRIVLIAQYLWGVRIKGTRWAGHVACTGEEDRRTMFWWKHYRTEITLKTYTQIGYYNKYRTGNAPITLLPWKSD